MKQLSGIHDLERILATVHHFRVPALVCINKADLNPAHSGAFQAYGLQQGIEVVGCLPYDTVVTEAMVQGLPVTVYQPEGLMAAALREMWARVGHRLGRGD